MKSKILAYSIAALTAATFALPAAAQTAAAPGNPAMTKKCGAMPTHKHHAKHAKKKCAPKCAPKS